MAVYTYSVRIEGDVVKGSLEAESAERAEQLLRENGWELLSVSEKRPLLNMQFGGSKAKMDDVLEFTAQLRTLTEAGLPLDRALKILMATLPNQSLRGVIRELLLDIEKGSPLAEAFAKHPSIFPRLYINMVKAGEEGGILPLTLARLIEFYERSIEFRNFLITSSIYPAALLVFGLSALVVLTVFVIPKFAEVFTNMGKDLPGAAAVLIGSSKFFTEHGIELLLAGVAAVVLFNVYVRTPSGKMWWHSILLRMPIVGDLILKTNLSRACRTLGTLLGAGVPILKALQIVSQLSDNLPVNLALSRLERGIRDGEGLAGPMRTDRFFPPFMTNLVTVGEETGDIGIMLVKVADQYDNDVRKSAKRFVALFEPMMIVVMGGLIGAIVVSMLTAIFSINEMGM
ncbi:type II secretion system F family protein [Parachitinimonas caeni]|uniref:Type II secretion system F family protein n=1 Tax=Parachitinimonas caeni TaxID=3031301 RepID=A0ABT7DUS3_9NEIS|nr:type II secretion system F family protein [Parachitinimonas caeni]MDK2122875.1 type II secretion system F family protein [Parachitinimonas caeni]